MNTNIKTIIIALFSAAIGFGAAYLFFNKNQSSSPSNEQHAHQHGQTATNEETIYTCSMHPQIRQPEMGICPICEMDLIPLEANTSNDPLVLEMTEEAVKLSNIQTTIVGQANETGKKSASTLRLSGKIQADETRTNSIVTHIPGRIEKLYIGFVGEYVQKGQAIARIYSPDLILVQHEIQEARKIQDLSPGLLDAAINKLKYWKLSDKTIEQILNSEAILESVDIYAQHSGVVTQKRVKVGDHLRLGMVLFDIQNLYKVWAVFDAYEKDLPYISIGDRIEFTSPALPNRTFKSRVTFIDPVINPQTRVAAIRTEIVNKNRLLKPEMFVNGVLKSSKKQAVAVSNGASLTVPKSAVLWTGKRSVVYVKVPDTDIPSYQYRKIEIGEGLGNTYQILSGLEAGEEVVTYGSFTIDAAAQLNNQQSMMNQKVNVKAAADAPLPNFQAETPNAFKSQLNDVANAYILLKDALVATDANTAPQAAQDFLKVLEKVEMNLLKAEAHEYWMEQMSALKSHATKITTLTDIEAQRKQFGFVSDALILAIQVFGTKGDALYVQHCPMAFNNQGADWLALEEGIRNPYFGDKMMKCGLVKKTLLSE